MLRIACLAATLLFCGCTCNNPDPSAKPGPSAAKKAPAKVPGARTGAPKKGGKAKAKVAAGAQGKQRKAGAPIGAAGELKGVMQLAQSPGKAEGTTKTDASVELRWGDDKNVVPLGSVPTPCKQVPPQPIGPADKSVTPLWTVECEGEKGSATLVVFQQANALQVRRSMTIEGGKASPYKLVKRVPLADGAKVVRAESFD